MKNAFRKILHSLDRFVERSLILDSLIQILTDNMDFSDLFTLLNPVITAIADRFRKKKHEE